MASLVTCTESAGQASALQRIRSKQQDHIINVRSNRLRAQQVTRLVASQTCYEVHFSKRNKTNDRNHAARSETIIAK